MKKKEKKILRELDWYFKIKYLECPECDDNVSYEKRKQQGFGYERCIRDLTRILESFDDKIENEKEKSA